MYKTEELTLGEFFNRFNISTFDEPEVHDIISEEYEIESWDEEKQEIVWKPIEGLVVKPLVQNYYQLGTLKGTSVHRVLYGGKWTELQNHPDAIRVEESMRVLDLMIQDTENYLAEGQINHNTTPGGLAIPYACSVRIRLLGGSQIKKTINGKEVIIGINVAAKTIKNKVGRPWREVEFEIHFGKGVVEDEQLFNALREHCEKASNPVIAPDGNKVTLSGTAAWKYFQVSDPKTGEIIHDEKFQKSTFKSNILENPKYEMYMKAIMDDCFIIKTETNEHKTIASVNLDSEVERSAFEQEKEGK